ncbi:Putative ribonuclease H protein At1g65750 [Linum perenne]
MTFPRADLGADSMVWGLESNGRFSIKSAYCLLKEINTEVESSAWMRVWNWKGPNKLIGWRLGGEGWYTLNTDGSLRSSTNSATAGGIIRDDNGRFVTAFASNLGCCSVVRAEIKGIVDGMAIAWEKGIRKLRIQTDSQLAVKLLLSEENINHQHSSLVHTFQEFKARNWEITIEHVYREANNAADFLANMGHDLDLGISMFSFPCNTLMEWIRYDLVGICQPRHVNIIL